MRSRWKEDAAGLSLIEMMVALLLGSLILSLSIEIQHTVKQQAQTHQALMEIQEAGLWLGQVLSSAIQLAGYHGCGAPHVVNRTSDPSFNFSSDSVFKVYRAAGNSWEPALPATLNHKVTPGTDVLSVMYLDPKNLTSIGDAVHRTDQIKVARPVDFKEKEKVMIADCEHAEIVQVTHIRNVNSQEAEIEITPRLLNSYASSAFLGAVVKNTFFIGSAKGKVQQGDLISAFYVEDTLGKDQEALQNVLSLNFNEDSLRSFSNKKIKFLTSKSLESISILLKSQAWLQTKPSTYEYQGKSYTAPDGALYEEWLIQVGRRNGL